MGFSGCVMPYSPCFLDVKVRKVFLRYRQAIIGCDNSTREIGERQYGHPHSCCF